MKPSDKRRKVIEAEVRATSAAEVSTTTDHWEKIHLEDKINQEVKQRFMAERQKIEAEVRARFSAELASSTGHWEKIGIEDKIRQEIEQCFLNNGQAMVPASRSREQGGLTAATDNNANDAIINERSQDLADEASPRFGVGIPKSPLIYIAAFLAVFATFLLYDCTAYVVDIKQLLIALVIFAIATSLVIYRCPGVPRKMVLVLLPPLILLAAVPAGLRYARLHSPHTMIALSGSMIFRPSTSDYAPSAVIITELRRPHWYETAVVVMVVNDPQADGLNGEQITSESGVKHYLAVC